MAELVNILRQTRALFEQENAHLPQLELEQRWHEHWSWITSQVTAPSPMAHSASTIPLKRPAPPMIATGSSKRPQPASAVPQQLSAHALERHLSAPAGPSHRRKYSVRSVQRPALQAHDSTAPRSVHIPQRPVHQRAHRNSDPAVSHTSWSRTRPSLRHIEEAQDFSPADFLARSPDQFQVTPAFSLTTSPVVERGEFLSPNASRLTTPYQVFDSDGSYSPMTATSDSSLTSASTVMSEPMSRCNTNDMICGPLDMLRMESNMSNISKCDLPDPIYHDLYDFDHTYSPFPASLPSDVHQNMSVLHTSHLSFQTPLSSQQPFPSSIAMKHSPSQESNASSASVSSHSRMSKRVQEQNAHGKSRPLMPKIELNDNSSSEDEMSKPNFVTVVEEDGTVRHKAEISRTTRQQPQRKTTHCTYCNDQPLGFHGDHELRRHIERHHSRIRKVWICRAPPGDHQFLDGCKACRNGKSYGANYNAAAHLRRAHFHPCKNKRGGRNKKSEGRGGMGGGNEPSMDFLKNWMYERLEINVNGTNVWQAYSADGDALQISMPDCQVMPESQYDDEDVADFDQLDMTHADAQSYDFNDGMLQFDPFHATVQPLNAFAAHPTYHLN